MSVDLCMQVNLLNSERSDDITILSARSLTFLADVLPSSAATIVRHGAVPALCARLLAVEDIDLAEQSLQVKFPFCILLCAYHALPCGRSPAVSQRQVTETRLLSGCH